MAVNDPTYGVPTPTGTLQGVAAFNWDGSTWQPAGRPSASIGTPTGVLRGVAPFTWSGSAWTPAGGGPDVATPTGVLDGVAVYTWSGSAWTPAGGGPDVPTPTGVLQGVAAFNWDGTAWQPSGQAGPDVPTPNGVLQGVAMFSFGGTGWTPTIVGTGLDISFVGAATLDARVTLTRGSVATYFDATGTLQTVSGNTPRLDYDPVTHASRGLLLEEARTNPVLNSGNIASWMPLAGATIAANQGVAPDGTTAMARFAEDASTGPHYGNELLTIAASTPYAYSIFARGGSGMRYLQLSADDGSVGNGAFATFDLQAGTISGPIAAVGTGTAGTASIQAIDSSGTYRLCITATVPGTAGRYMVLGSNAPAPGWVPSYPGNPANSVLIWGMQVEQGAFPTSYIPTAGVAVTRAADTATIASIPGRVATGESYAAEFVLMAQTATPRIIGSATTAHGPIYLDNTAHGGSTDTVASVVTANAYTFGSVGKIATTWTTPNAAKVCLNAGAVASATTLTSGFSTVTSFKFLGDSVTADHADGWIRRFRYWPRVLSNTEMQQVTT